MSDFEDILRRSLGERAASVRTAPDEGDVMRRIGRAERASSRGQRAVLVAALVVVAGSTGGVLGAVASRPAGVPLLQASDGSSNRPAAAAPPRSGAAAGAATSGQHDAPFAPAAIAPAPLPIHEASFGAVSVDWMLTSLAQPVEVVPGAGAAATCTTAAVVSLTIGAGSPIASSTGSVGMPALQPQGLAVVSSGTFGSAGHVDGWWAALVTGSAATDVAVQFPSGAVERAPVQDGIAVVASLATGVSSASGFAYGSAVAEGAKRAFGSLEFLFGGGIAAVGASTGGGRPLSSCPVSAAIAGAASAGDGGGPPAPLAAAGDVVAAYAQAYSVVPLLGLTWNFAAVDLASPLGCPYESLAAGSGTPADGLAAPAVQVEAVDFTGPASAVVVYRKSAGGLLETGTAVLVDGAWKVGGAGYCADMAAAGS